METSFTSQSLEQTLAYGKRLGSILPPNSVVCLTGHLGAGKTHLVKGIVAGATGISSDEVSSPTFVYLSIYKGPKTVYHFDLYRLHDVDEFLSMGFDEYFTAGGICCVEWPERLGSLMPENAICIGLRSTGEDQRLITIESGEVPHD